MDVPRFGQLAGMKRDEEMDELTAIVGGHPAIFARVHAHAYHQRGIGRGSSSNLSFERGTNEMYNAAILVFPAASPSFSVSAPEC